MVSASLTNWDLDLTDLEVNARHFDVVTRTYLFRLDLEETDLPAAVELRAYFESADGRLMEAEYVMPMPR